MIKIHNTLSGKVEAFEPMTPGEVRMYVCGVTPYDVCHLGHARCYVVFDVVRRVLKAQGWIVRFIQNFTDVDDKIIARAVERKMSPLALAQENIDDFYKKMDALGIERANMYPRVTEHIPDIIEFIQHLIDQEFAYVLDGDVYFSVRKDADYGKLSKRSLDDLIAGARVDVRESKRDPLDFALWKASKPGEPEEVSWTAPWGKGRPGWHIECSVMSLKHLDGTFDIHGGGLDLIFPHHENEIAQSESATGETFARFWIHNGFVTVNKEKMSKSLGNFFSLGDIFKSYEPMVVRYFLLTTHYRSPLNFSDDLLNQAKQTLSRLRDSVARAKATLKNVDPASKARPEVIQETESALVKLNESLTNDFNTPEALAVLHQLAGLLDHESESKEASGSTLKTILRAIETATECLGLTLTSKSCGDIPDEVRALAKARQEARKNKDWKESDRLRDAIAAQGYVLEDTPSGPRLILKQ